MFGTARFNNFSQKKIYFIMFILAFMNRTNDLLNKIKDNEIKKSQNDEKNVDELSEENLTEDNLEEYLKNVEIDEYSRKLLDNYLKNKYDEK